MGLARLCFESINFGPSKGLIQHCSAIVPKFYWLKIEFKITEIVEGRKKERRERGERGGHSFECNVQILQEPVLQPGLAKKIRQKIMY